MKKWGKWKPVLTLVGICLVITLLFGSGMTQMTAGYTKASLPLEEALIEGAVPQEDGSALAPAHQYIAFTFYNWKTPVKTLSVTTTADPAAMTSVTVTAFLVQYTAAGEEILTETDHVLVNPAGKQNTCVLSLRCDGEYDNFRLVFGGHLNDFTITDISVNQSGFFFNFPQFFFLLAIGLLGWFLWDAKIYRLAYADDNLRHRACLYGVAGLCVLFVVWLLFAVTGPHLPRLLPYDPADTASLQALFYDEHHHTQYYQLFDALFNGQLSLRAAPDAGLAALTNPYDPAQRGDIQYIWDMAYYNGKYYCYYGLAPMPLYFAFYFVLGRLPSAAVACAVPAILTVLFACGAVRELLRYFKIRPNLLLLLLGFPAMLGASLLFTLMSCADSYEQPYLWAMAGLAGFVWLFFLALRILRPGLRRLCFALAGVCVVYIAASRPSVLLFCLVIALPVGLGYLRDDLRGRSEKASSRFFDVFSLAVPVVLGAAGLMLYNYYRFDSPFSFGNTYQLTVWDMRAQGFRPSPVWLFQALYYFLCQPLLIEPRFPFVAMAESAQNTYGSYFFNYTLLGLLNFPLYWGLAATPKTLRKQSLTKKVFYIGILASSVFVLWYTYCVGNLLYRYACDVSLALGFVALLVFLEVFSCRPPGRRRGLYTLACFACCGTILLGFFLCFANERNFILSFNPDVYISVSKLFAVL